MASRKPSARAKQQRAFKSQESGLDDLFAHEHERLLDEEREREEHYRDKACLSKRRYTTREEALESAAWCADRGRPGLRVYRCRYCNGWHLTSKPPRAGG